MKLDNFFSFFSQMSPQSCLIDIEDSNEASSIGICSDGGEDEDEPNSIRTVGRSKSDSVWVVDDDDDNIVTKDVSIKNREDKNKNTCTCRLNCNWGGCWFRIRFF